MTESDIPWEMVSKLSRCRVELPPLGHFALSHSAPVQRVSLGQFMHHSGRLQKYTSACFDFIFRQNHVKTDFLDLEKQLSQVQPIKLQPNSNGGPEPKTEAGPVALTDLISSSHENTQL